MSAKILLRKGKKKFFEDLNKEVTIAKQSQFFVEDTAKDFHCKDGLIKKQDLKKIGTVKTNTKKEYSIFDASFIDHYKKMKRLAQIIPLKDIGYMFSQTLPQKDFKVIEAGSGSGALSLFYAPYVKQVISYDIEKEHQDVVKENMKRLGIKNIQLKLKNVYEKIDEKDADLLFLDLPEPWKVINNAEKALKQGAFIVSYSPSIPQTQDFVNSILKHDSFVHIKTVEIIEREWEIDKRKVRPKSKSSIHSGFLSFCRKI
jgi:tRNA (adenine57-N1/adenine58-N1)-methyltransferase